ncbi:MAG: T9SS type A sorting domain-containing protein [Sphingobacteriales bacterium]|nr:MAG: T9SS type A sorting domain-containing protein [Sphingobacteriales bacterium]
MIRKTLLIGSAIAFFLNANAQITLNQSNVTFSAREVNRTAIAVDSFTNPQAGTNQSWDYGKLKLIGEDPFTYLPSTNSGFSNSAITESAVDPIVTGRFVNYDNYLDANANGLMLAGYAADYQVYPIGDLTGNASDTFYIPMQTQVYANPMYNLKFPTTSTSMWTNDTRWVLNFMLTVTNFGLNKVPGSKVSNYSRKDEVKGWGKMRVPFGEGKSAWYDVLMVQKSIKRVDSFYMNGSPAPAMLTGAFGVSQGATTNEYRTYFYRAGDFYPLMYINYGTDANFTAPMFAYYTTDNLSASTSLEKQRNNFSAAIYPNPVTGNELNISFYKENNKKMQINIVNVLGRSVKSIVLNQPNGNINQVLEIDNAAANGVYFVQITDADGTVLNSSKIILNR